MERTDGYVSWWVEEAGAGRPREPEASGPLPAAADVVIVGGGFTGLWTAIRLRERQPGLDVCVVERRFCGFGASGRNGGIAEPSWAKFPAMVSLYGTEDAVRLGRAIHDGVGELQRFCSAHGIEADLRLGGHLWMASNRSQLGAWDKAVSALEAAGERRLRRVDADTARQLSGSPTALGGVVEDEAGSLQPAKLVAGLRRVALAGGAAVHEGVAVKRLRRGRGGRIGVVTTAGTIAAAKVVVATNAWAAALGPVRPHVFVTSSDVIATPPGVAVGAGGEVAAGMAVSDSRRMINYWRSTPDGRVVFGKGGGAMSVGNRVDRRFSGPSGRARSVHRAFGRLYPQLAAVAAERSWCGPIDYSSTGLPYFGPLHPGRPAVLTGVGYSGMGVVQSVLGGR
ncbi:MAG TPA: FAD-binding oxidoreductase, partial [Acidimicrobiales bacterium]|nr:FAD-binding oxidoreductase [Acidimicrobiales bacterium]